MFLGLDLGTTNVKAAVFDQAGKMISRAAKSIQLFYTRDGGVEQDFEEIWAAVICCAKEAVGRVAKGEIRAVGVSSQGGAMQIINPDGGCLGRVISWLDQRGAPFDQNLTAELGQRWFQENISHGGSWLAIGQLLRLRSAESDLLQAPNKIRFVGDLVVERLCGRAGQDGTSAALTLLYDPRRRRYSSDLLARLGLQSSQLPDLLWPEKPAGQLHLKAAQETDLTPGIPIGPAVHDQYASALGTGAVENGTVMIGAGTAWVLLVVSQTALRPAHPHALICHHLVPSLWGQILSLVVGGSAIRWATALAGRTDADCAAIDRMLAAVPAGADGLQFWPFLTPAIPCRLPPGTRGRLVGLQLHHRTDHLLRAVVEGLAFELKRNLALLQNDGAAINRLILSGGAAISAVTPSILADVTGLPVACYTGDASLAGAGLLARALVEPKIPLAQVSLQRTAPSATCAPRDLASVYSKLYKQYLESLPIQS